jgi:hypothetical protein
MITRAIAHARLLLSWTIPPAALGALLFVVGVTGRDLGFACAGATIGMMVHALAVAAARADGAEERAARAADDEAQVRMGMLLRHPNAWRDRCNLCSTQRAAWQRVNDTACPVGVHHFGQCRGALVPQLRKRSKSC